MRKREPFLVNPHVGILNPRKKKGKSMAKKWGKSHMAWVRSHKRSKGRKRTTRKHNPYPLAGLVVNARRKGGKRRSTRRHNPPMSVLGFSLPDTNKLIYTGAGFIAPPFVENAIRPMLPASLTTGTGGRYLIKAGSVVLTTLAAKMLAGGEKARSVALGGTLYVLVSAWGEFVAPMISGAPAAVPEQTQAYVSAGRVSSNSNVRAYVRGSSRNFNTLGLPSAAFSGGNSGAVGGTAARFKRF